jgi:hypothetical protein
LIATRLRVEDLPFVKNPTAAVLAQMFSFQQLAARPERIPKCLYRGYEPQFNQ